MKPYRKLSVGSLAVLTILTFCVFELIADRDVWADSRREAALNPLPSAIPDRIVLTWRDNPVTSQAVTWRTDSTVKQAFAEIAPADPSPDFTKKAQRFQAKTTLMQTESGRAVYHSVNFENLHPNMLYAYRVGSSENWSEWFHFRTASDQPGPFSFIYFGDAQNNVLSLWSRAIRSAYSDAPKARFMIHAGDLVDHANRDREWGEWFQAGGWIHSMVPCIPIPGNHEYARDENGVYRLSHYWRPQFTLPEHGVEGLEETVYYIDYQGVRIIGLNSNERLEEQAVWLDKALQNNSIRWTVVTFHHPVFSSAKGRDNKRLRELWKPILDKYRVDIVLQGHDHTYARGRNLSLGVSVQDPKSGTVYVVSISGPKMYKLTPNRWMDRAAENTQLFQVISVTQDTLHYQAITVTGELYDAFDLIKQEGAANLLVERISSEEPERTFKSTSGKR
ncbi:metallophosphoesterase family protein [candidate division TA06 bacterium]|nr:metallophosphoesterase family protein [candidate division TA06 bacterium]